MLTLCGYLLKHHFDWRLLSRDEGFLPSTWGSGWTDGAPYGFGFAAECVEITKCRICDKFFWIEDVKCIRVFDVNRPSRKPGYKFEIHGELYALASEAMPNLQPFLFPKRLKKLQSLQPDAWLLQERAISKRDFSKVEREWSIRRSWKRIKDEKLKGDRLQVTRGVIVIQTRFKTIEEQITAWKEIIAIDPTTKHGKIYQITVDRLEAKLESTK